MPTHPTDLDLPRLPGTYVLFLHVSRRLPLAVGRLGPFALDAGLVAYVGSAHGPGGLQARIARHLRAEKPQHWHIDTLTGSVPVQSLWWTAAPTRLECAWAHAFRTCPGASIPIPRFGASDCACPAHLFALDPAALPSLWNTLAQPAWLDLL